MSIVYTILSLLRVTGSYLKNKSISLGLLAVAYYAYTHLPQPAPDQPPLPFTEVLYAIVTLLTAVAIAPLLRLVLFHEAADYAESNLLDKDLAQPGFPPTRLLHYWFATLICYAATILIMVSVTK